MQCSATLKWSFLFGTSFNCVYTFCCFDVLIFVQVKDLRERFPAVTPLALVLKQFLADRSLDQSYSGGLSSYCLVGFCCWMYLSLDHLQHCPSRSWPPIILLFY